jgi:NADH:ubiquinone oxidoreductase subunit 3 (subunit A)
MLEDFAAAGIWLLIALAFPLVAILMATFLRPRRPNPIKYENYECGIESEGGSWVKYNFKFYLYALVFVIFDIEVVFLFPWAVAFRQLKLFGFIEMLIFVLILVVGYLYAWKKRALEWR